jgi:hypothetical protein
MWYAAPQRLAEIRQDVGNEADTPMPLIVIVC